MRPTSMITLIFLIFGLFSVPLHAADKELKIPAIPSCPHPDGHINDMPPQNRPMPAMDKDGDGKPDRRYFKYLDKNGNNFEIWCLDKGRTGDYAVYASAKGKTDKTIHKCVFRCGKNRISITLDGKGLLKRFRGVNWDPRLKPRGTGGDRDYYYNWQTGKFRTVKTKDKYPKTVRTARYISDPITSPIVDSTAFANFVGLPVDDTPEDPLTGLGTLAIVDVNQFEALREQYLIEIDVPSASKVKTHEVLYYPVVIVVNDITFDAELKAITVTLAKLGINDGEGELSLVIPRGMLDNLGRNNQDKSFGVIADSNTIVKVEEYNSDTDRIVYMKFPLGVKQIVVRGNLVGRTIEYPVLRASSP